MSEHTEIPTIARPIDTLMSMGFRMIDFVRVDMFKTRIGEVNVVAALWPDGEVEMQAKADGVDASLTLRRVLRAGTPAEDCKVAVLDLWKHCVEHSSRIAPGVAGGSEGRSPNITSAADFGQLPFSALLIDVMTLPSISVDRDELLRALDRLAELDLLADEAQASTIGLAAVNGTLLIVTNKLENHVPLPILAGEWPTAFVSNGTAAQVATMIRGASAAPGPTIQLLLTCDGVHVGEWKIGGTIVEQ